jgi:hypothetical protein
MGRSQEAEGCNEANQPKAMREQDTKTELPLLLPVSPARAYDWKMSTSENYRSPERKFFGPYASIRSTLDYEYHAHYTCARQSVQDQLITAALQENRAPAGTRPVASPWVVFTCGAMGSGKSHVLAWMKQRGFLPLQNLVLVDADLLRTRLPEWKGLVSLSPEKAGSLTHSESVYCIEILQV